MKWQWFVGGRGMFWVSIVSFIVLAVAFVFTYVLDPTTLKYMVPQKIDATRVKEESENYVKELRH